MNKTCVVVLMMSVCGCDPHRRYVRQEAPVPTSGGAVAGSPGAPPEVPKVAENGAVPKVKEAEPDLPAKHRTRDPAEAAKAVNGRLKDAYFDYDRAELRPDALDALREDAALLVPILPEFPDLKVAVEGHCDERGSAEYNLGLGDRRAAQAAVILRKFGIPAGRMQTVSYGKEAPQCTESAESCWKVNRRAHLVARVSGPTD